ncbi:MAG: hypothetical protein ACOWWR_08025 [Eubacteriales bacterium]
MKRKRSLSLIISAVLGTAYAIYLIIYFGGGLMASTTDADVIGGAIATALVTPHMVCVAIAAIFNILAVFNYKRGFALTGAILYTCAALVFIMYGTFLLPMIVLSFIGFARLKKINEDNLLLSQDNL